MAIAVSRASRSRGSRSRDAGRCRMPFRRRATGGDQGTVTDCCSPPAAICDASSRSSRSSLKVISTARGRPTAGKLVRPEEMATFGKAPGVSGRLLTRARCERSQARTPNSIYGTRLDPRSVGMISRKFRTFLQIERSPHHLEQAGRRPRRLAFVLEHAHAGPEHLAKNAFEGSNEIMAGRLLCPQQPADRRAREFKMHPMREAK